MLAPVATVLIPIPDTDFDPTEVAVSWQVLTARGHTVRFSTESGVHAVADRMLPDSSGGHSPCCECCAGERRSCRRTFPSTPRTGSKQSASGRRAPKREVRYAVCDNRRTLLWFANQRAIGYHPT